MSADQHAAPPRIWLRTGSCICAWWAWICNPTRAAASQNCNWLGAAEEDDNDDDSDDKEEEGGEAGKRMRMDVGIDTDADAGGIRSARGYCDRDGCRLMASSIGEGDDEATESDDIEKGTVRATKAAGKDNPASAQSK